MEKEEREREDRSNGVVVIDFANQKMNRVGLVRSNCELGYAWLDGLGVFINRSRPDCATHHTVLRVGSNRSVAMIVDVEVEATRAVEWEQEKRERRGVVNRESAMNLDKRKG